MNRIADIVDMYAKKEERSRQWIAKKINVSKTTIYSKFTNDNFTAIELLILSEILHFDLNELRDKVTYENLEQ